MGALSGRGTVYSWVVVHQSQHPAFNPDTPYNVVIVELEEGPRLHGNRSCDCRQRCRSASACRWKSSSTGSADDYGAGAVARTGFISAEG